MLVSAVRAAIVTAIEAITPSKRAGKRDKFRHVDTGGRDADALRDRTFRVALSMQPQPQHGLGSYVAGFVLEIAYSAGAKGIEDRIATDGARIATVLEYLHRTEPQINTAQITPAGVSQPTDSQLTSTYSIVVSYVADAAVIQGL